MARIPFLMRSIPILVLLVQLAGIANLSANDLIPYISPGIKIGWDSKGGFTMGPKLSFGLADDLDGGKFINLTIGIKSFQTSIINGTQFVFLDLQIGSTLKGESWIFFGGGAGLLFGKGERGYKIVPRTTFFLGFILFPTIDIAFWGEDITSYEPGFELLLPFPLRKLD